MRISVDDPASAWTLTAGANRLDIRFRPSGLVCDDPTDGIIAGAPVFPGDDISEAPVNPRAMVEIGTQRRPVTWQLRLWLTPDDDTVEFVMHATEHPLAAHVTFRSDPDTGLFTRRTLLRHRGGDQTVSITGALSIWFNIRAPIERIVYLAGVWAEEAQVRTVAADHLPLVLESQVGKTGFAYQPYAALRAGGATWLCQLFWSGNWLLRIARVARGTSLVGGLNPWGFHHRLRPGTELALPEALFGRIDGDLDQATRALHDFRRRRRPDPDRPIPVQFNTWYPWQGDPPANELLELIPLAARLGCEVFVLDAGWYRTIADDPSEAWDLRAGDWRVNRRLFPAGLRQITAACHANGLKFGIWIEPEAVGPSADIRRRHPEWLHHIDGQPPATRAVLNLGVPAARAYVRATMTRILSATGAAWMKWDFNADLGAGGWAPELPASLRDNDPLVAHYEGLYRLQDEIRAAFPALVLEMCSSGGGRMDGAILAHAHTNWISDQPRALPKLATHFGIQLAHPAVVCNDWLIDWPPGALAGDAAAQAPPDDRGDLRFRLHVAMLGSFGISAHLARFSAADFALVAEHVAIYRSVLRPLIHHGDQYRLTQAPPLNGNGDWAALWYVAKDGSGGALFAFRLAGADEAKPFRLPGLDRSRRYVVRERGSAEPGTAEDLAAGRLVTLADRYRSTLILVQPDDASE